MPRDSIGTAWFRDRRLRRLILIVGLSAAAPLLNPYGPRLYAEVRSFPANPNLSDLIEWHHLAFDTTQGQIAAGAAVLLAVSYCLARRRISAGEGVALVTFGAAAWWSARMLIWWTPPAAGALALNAHAAWRRFRPVVPRAAPARFGAAPAVAATAMIFIAVATTPFGWRLISRRGADLAQCVSSQTPVAAAAWLNGHEPAGQIFNTLEWGDYLVWAGPADVRVFVTSQVHMVPRSLWRDYMAVIDASPDWREIIDRRQVETIVVDKLERGALIAELNRDRDWQRVYEDEIAVIYERRKR